jgi:hypothetical protein
MCSRCRSRHAFDYATGDLARMGNRVPHVLPAWSSDLPGYHAVLAIQGFELVECGDFERAEEFCQQALALNLFDARAHHALAHVFEMTGRAEAGVHWMNQRIAYWAADTVVATHCWWHLALFHLAQGTSSARAGPTCACVPVTRTGCQMIDAGALWRMNAWQHRRALGQLASAGPLHGRLRLQRPALSAFVSARD